MRRELAKSLRQQAILAYLEANPSVRLATISAAMGIGEDSIMKSLRVLERDGEIRRVKAERRGCFGQRVRFTVFEAAKQSAPALGRWK